jgi:hypothetical protein
MLSRNVLRRAVLPVTFALGAAAQSSVNPPSAPAKLPSPFGSAHTTLDYDVEWRLVTAGHAKLDLYASPVMKDGWESKLHLESIGLVSRLFHVSDDYTLQMNNSLCATSTYMSAREGNRSRDTKVTFDGASHKADFYEKDLRTNAVDKKESEIPPCVHDIIGGLFVLRTLNLEPGKSGQIPVSTGKKTAYLKVAAERREEIKVPAGMQKTVRYEVFAFDNQLYNRPGHLHVWLTDDSRHVPVQIEIRLQFVIGTVTLRLSKETQS